MDALFIYISDSITSTTRSALSKISDAFFNSDVNMFGFINK